MTTLNSIKLMPYVNLPTTTDDTDMYAVPADLNLGVYAPNYAAQISLSTNTTYTVGSGVLAGYTKGYLLFGTTARLDDCWPRIHFNDVYAALSGADGDFSQDWAGYASFIPVITGDTFYIDATNGSDYIGFVPTKE